MGHLASSHCCLVAGWESIPTPIGTRYTPPQQPGSWRNEIKGDLYNAITLNLPLISLVNTLQRTYTENLKQIFPEKELRDRSPHFHIHVSDSDFYTFPRSICLYSAAGNMWTDPGSI